MGDRKADYIVVHHMEPDHSANVYRLMEMYPEAKIVVNKMIARMLGNYFDNAYPERHLIVEEGSVLDLGEHKLTFVMAPNVHWPEVMLSYDSKDKILFSADGFGRFGPIDEDYEWDDEARRYFINIVGRFGDYVMDALGKAAGLEIDYICPLHGPVLNKDLGKYLGLYKAWASYEPETKGVFIAYTSVYGHTARAAMLLAKELEDRGVDVEIYDLARNHVSFAISDAFRYDRLVLMTTTYENGIFPVMEHFVREIGRKNLKNRKVGVVDNGSWGPVAGKQIKELENLQKEMANKVKSFMGEVGKGESDNFKVSWPTTSKTTFDHKRFAEEHPDVDLTNYYKTSSYRTFKVTERK
jgi:flavorubredoxin